MNYQEWCAYHDIVPNNTAHARWKKMHEWFTINFPDYLHGFYKLPPYAMRFTDTTAVAEVKLNHKTTTRLTVEILEDKEPDEVPEVVI